MNGMRITCGPSRVNDGHAVAGLPEVLDQRELAVGVGADEPAVHLEVLRRRREVLAGERGVGLAQIDLGLDRGGATRPPAADRLPVAHQRAADEIDLVHRPARAPVGHPLRRHARCRCPGSPGASHRARAR